MLNSQDVIPLYQQVENVLRKKIHAGEFEPSMRLPTEAELAEEFGVSTITVKKAVLNLVDQGLLKRKQGKGTFVVSEKQSRDMRQVMSFSQVCSLNGTTPGSKTLEQCVIPATANLQAKLETKDEKVVLIKRLRYVDGKPMALEINWFSMNFAFLLTEDLNNKSLFALIDENQKVTLFSARRSIEICYARPQESELLHIAQESPLLLVDSTVFDERGTPVFVGRQVINADHFKLIV